MPLRWKVASTGTTVALLVAVVVAVLVVVAKPGARHSDADSALGVSAGLARFAEAERRNAPDIEGPLVSGSGTASISHPGKVVVVNVWQSTCGPCRGEADALEAAARTTTDATFVGLDVVDQQAAAQAFLRTSGSTYPHIFDPDAQQLLKFNGILPVQAIPSTAVIDKQGRIAARVIGPVSTHTLIQLVAEAAASS